jgi:transcriptional regulator with XRE-family HTH domain
MIGERVRAERLARGWTQAELARHSGVSQATLSRIEEGHVASPRLPVLQKLAAALRITIDSLAEEGYQLSMDDVLRRDPRAQAIFSGYERLPEDKRNQIADFVRFLEGKKGGEEEEEGASPE